MTLTETEELQAYRRALRAALHAEPRPHDPADPDEISGWTKAVRGALASLDAFGLLVDEAAGGSAGGYEAVLVVLEEVGRAGVGRWFASSAVLGAHLLARSGSETARRLLADVAAGSRLVTPAVTGPSGRCEAAAVTVAATARVGGEVLDGGVAFVPGGTEADVFLVAGRRPDGTTALFAVERSDDGVAVGGTAPAGVNGLASLRLDGVRVPADRLVAPLDDAAWRELVTVGAVAVSAEMVGSADRVLELTVAYAADRHQFGAPIGAFEMVQHHCVEMRTDVRAARSVTAKAARALDAARDDRHRMASVAKAWTARALRRVVARGHAVHGAIGFSAEHELPRHSAAQVDSWALWGDPAFHADQVAGTL